MKRMKLINAGAHRLVKLALICLFCLLFASASAKRLTISDENNCVKCHRQATGRALEVVEIHITAELIHPTDHAGGVERIPMILSQGEKLKQEIKRLQTRPQ